MVNGKVGAAAVLVRQGATDNIARYHLGPDTEHEVYEAEIVGLQLALHLLENERDAEKVEIYVDNQAVLKTLEAKEAENMVVLFRQIKTLLNRVTGRFLDLEMETRWIPGHVTIPCGPQPVTSRASTRTEDALGYPA